VCILQLRVISCQFFHQWHQEGITAYYMHHYSVGYVSLEVSVDGVTQHVYNYSVGLSVFH
jgi:hypothetical protein